MNAFLKNFLSTAGMTAGLILAASPAHAVYNIVMTETGGNVVATGSGSINTAGMNLQVLPNTCNVMSPSGRTLCMGSGTAGLYSSLATPLPSFGTGFPAGLSSSSGHPFFVSDRAIYLPAGYVSGSALSSTATWNAKTFASLGVTPGTYTWSFGGGVNADSVVLNIVGATAPASAPLPPIPSNVALPGVPGVGAQLTVLDLTSGSGPSMTTCLLSTITQMFGADAIYMGQSTNGAARISVGGQTISFYPLAASTSTAQGTGVFLSGNNSANIGTSCGTFNVIPAVANMSDFGTALTALGLRVQLDANGVITGSVNGSLYVVRPDYFVTQGTATGTPSVVFGTDGVLRFTDSAGKVQILRAAFLDPVGLQSAMGTTSGGTLSIQVDGSGVFTLINGSQLLLAPDMVLSLAPNGLGSANWVNDRASHYLYRIATYYQGLMATERISSTRTPQPF